MPINRELKLTKKKLVVTSSWDFGIGQNWTGIVKNHLIGTWDLG